MPDLPGAGDMAIELSATVSISFPVEDGLGEARVELLEDDSVRISDVCPGGPVSGWVRFRAEEWQKIVSGLLRPKASTAAKFRVGRTSQSNVGFMTDFGTSQPEADQITPEEFFGLAYGQTREESIAHAERICELLNA